MRSLRNGGVYFVLAIELASEAEDEEDCVLLGYRTKQPHGIIVAILGIIDDHHPWVPEGASRQSAQKLMQHFAFLFLGQYCVAQTRHEIHVEELIKNAKVFWFTFMIQS